MALGSLINPQVGGWLTGHRNTLAGLGSGLLNGTPGSGVQAGIQADDAYATQQKAEAERQKQIADQSALRAKYASYFQTQGRPDVAQGIADGIVDPATAYWDHINPKQTAQADPSSTVGGRAQLAQTWGLQGDEAKEYVLTGKLPGGNATARAGVGAPVPYYNKKTKQFIAVQPMTSGPGQDLATGNPFDNSTGDWVYAPDQQAQARAAGAAYGTAGGTSAANLPASAVKAEEALGVIQNLRGLNADGTPNANYAQGRADTFGTYGIGPIQIPDKYSLTIAGTPKADYQSLLDQAGGQQFLTAYQGLRGTGAISEAEGQQAKDAVARMSNAQSDKAFQSALDDYDRIIRKGYEVEKAKTASVGYGDNAPTLSSGGNTTSTGVTWSVGP